jgi:hypothetical protein
VLLLPAKSRRRRLPSCGAGQSAKCGGRCGEIGRAFALCEWKLPATASLRAGQSAECGGRSVEGDRLALSANQAAGACPRRGGASRSAAVGLMEEGRLALSAKSSCGRLPAVECGAVRWNGGLPLSRIQLRATVSRRWAHRGVRHRSMEEGRLALSAKSKLRAPAHGGVRITHHGVRRSFGRGGHACALGEIKPRVPAHGECASMVRIAECGIVRWKRQACTLGEIKLRTPAHGGVRIAECGVVRWKGRASVLAHSAAGASLTAKGPARSAAVVRWKRAGLHSRRNQAAGGGRLLTAKCASRSAAVVSLDRASALTHSDSGDCLTAWAHRGVCRPYRWKWGGAALGAIKPPATTSWRGWPNRGVLQSLRWK